VEHDTTIPTYALIPLETNRNDPLNFVVTEWKNGDGNLMENEKFSGNEQSVSVKILKADQVISVTNARSNEHCVVVAQGGTVKDYSVAYESDWSSAIPDPVYNATKDRDEYIYNIKLTKTDVSNDYTFKSILGPGVYYGITANRFEQKNHIQSNFATNYYEGNGYPVEPDLASSMGAIIMSDATQYTEGEKTYDIFIGNSKGASQTDKNILIYSNHDDCLKDPRNFVTVIKSDTDTLKNNYVDPIINYATTISNQLVEHTSTIIPDVGTGKVLIDTTAFPDNATIYIAADGLSEKLADAGNLQIKKKEDQLLVFNFSSTTNLHIHLSMITRSILRSRRSSKMITILKSLPGRRMRNSH
jgi:hypothetical protein